MVLDAIEGGRQKHIWRTIVDGDFEFIISNVMQIHEGDGAWKRVFGASGEMADIVAGRLGLLLPTQKLLEVVEASDGIHAKGPFTQKNGAQGMTREAADRHAAMHPDYGYEGVSGEGKSIVLHNHLWTDPKRVMIYGTGPWSLQGLYMGHFYREFWDYSQGLGPFLHPNCWYKGERMDIRNVMMDSKLASLVSFYGRLRGWHHPAAAEAYKLHMKAELPVLVQELGSEPIPMEFIQAAKYTPIGNRVRDIKWLVLHTAEVAESETSAENLAAWASRGVGMDVSWHYAIDNDSIVHCVKDNDRAWCAGRTGNDHGLHVELAGYARQGPEEWDDDFSRSMLALASRLVRDKCEEHSLPMKFVDAAGLRAGEKGITDHDEITKAFGESTHRDVGKSFPWGSFLEAVRGG